MPQPYNRCRRCGASIAPGAQFCAHCGAWVAEIRAPPPFWKILLAILISLAFFAVAGFGGLLAACAASPGINQSAPTAEGAAMAHKILAGLAVLFVVWVAAMVLLLK